MYFRHFLPLNEPEETELVPINESTQIAAFHMKLISVKRTQFDDRLKLEKFIPKHRLLNNTNNQIDVKKVSKTIIHPRMSKITTKRNSECG